MGCLAATLSTYCLDGYYLKNSNCVSNCGNEYFEDEKTRTCQCKILITTKKIILECRFACKKCVNSDSCSECFYSHRLNPLSICEPYQNCSSWGYFILPLGALTKTNLNDDIFDKSDDVCDGYY